MVSQEGLKNVRLTAVRRGLALSERRLLLGIGDTMAVALAFLIAFNARTAQIRHLGVSVPRVALAITVGVWLLAALLVDGYKLSGVVNLRGTFRTVVGSMAISFMGLLVVFFVVPYRITRPTLVLWLPVAAMALLLWRVAYRQVFAREVFAGSLVVLAEEQAFQRVWPDSTGVMRGLYRVIAVVDPARSDCREVLQELVGEGRVDQLVLGVGDGISRDLFRILMEVYDKGVPVRSLADLYEELTGRMMLDQLGHSWLLSLPMRSETSRIYSGFKRLVDVAAGVLGLVLLSLILPVVTLAMKMDDGGPVLYRQHRVGLYGRDFQILKLRTMRQALSPRVQQTAAADVRITRLGRWLRRLHIDELPQGWNMIKGEMSLIGPRPEQPPYVESLRQQIDFYNTRLSVRPGLTGWAQINYGYGAGVEGARTKLSYDLYYVKRQSVALDLLILFRTVYAVVVLKSR